jgi:hypothetical protein
MYECRNHKKTELWIKIYGPWKLSRAKQSFQERYGVFLEFWSGWRILAQKTLALAKFGKFSEIFVDFWSIWSGLGAFCNYFLEAKGLALIFPND